MTFTTLGPTDVDLLAGWVKQYFDHDGLEFNASVVEGLNELLSHPEYGIAWEVWADGMAVGYCVLTYGFDHEAGGRIGVVTDIYLLEEIRGRGIGTTVLNHCVAHGRQAGLKQLELFVLRHNPGAKKLYERIGFSTSEDREFLSMNL